jgi:hypothetical protein
MKNIIGNSKKLGSLEIAEFYFDDEDMSWDEAQNACTKLGEGWRLPTKEELNEMYKHKEEIGGFDDLPFWSSSICTEDKSLKDLLGYQTIWVQFFHNGMQMSILGPAYTRAVRILEM